MPRLLNDLKIMLLANAWIIPVLGALVGAVFFFVAPPPPMTATLATGQAGSAYAEFGEKLRAVLARQGFELTLVNSGGSRDNLQRLLNEDSGISLAMVQSGLERQLDANQRERLLSLGALYQEPLWLFHQKHLNVDRIADLRQLRVGLGGRNSGTAEVSEAIMQANQIAPADYPPGWQSLGGSTAAQALLKGELDAAFFIATPDSPLVQQLALSPALRLGSFTRTAAYEARLPFLRHVAVGEGLLNLAQNSPDRDILTLAPVATLVSNEQFHPALVPLLLQAVREVMQEGSLLDAPGAYPSAEPTTFSLSPDAAHYYAKGLPLLQRYLPFRIASLADRYIILLIPLLVVLIPLFKAVGPLYRWRIRARIYRWYKHLREIDRQLNAGTLPERLDAEILKLEQLEDELAKVDVPLSYSNELYELHVHLRYVVERLRALQQRQGLNG
ncbi:TAXI family TRAP transporter solute-binding subunit [Pseudomonas sp. N040]|uniref:TAXI family TRAP transporter solute-binding subunit n=1 Tax=Pseudomonas sp. N040 TaxID=2785325 RepID=UPI0018A2E1F7|nr:TAXI family TRAP transporter solute-binding subunit [Pseudomonas sp. N040]MBF7730461.1 ABC transporter substrate-binding protein [Pseudomonas sp. N040]MBW7014104.1 ABC transporter substrate-binding protein [Pseudomonas sp. N040]